jgi:hypothetical protein
MRHIRLDMQVAPLQFPAEAEAVGFKGIEGVVAPREVQRLAADDCCEIRNDTLVTSRAGG